MVRLVDQPARVSGASLEKSFDPVSVIRGAVSRMYSATIHYLRMGGAGGAAEEFPARIIPICTTLI